jgi:hypothetical protein
LLWTVKPEPLHPVVATVPAEPEHVPGRSPSPFGSGPAVPAAEPAHQPALPAARAASATVPAAHAGPMESPAEQRVRFDKLRWFGTDAAELAALARKMDAALPSVLQAGAIDTGNALVLKTDLLDLLDVLELDPMRRRDRLVEWWAAHPAAGPGTRSAQPSRRRGPSPRAGRVGRMAGAALGGSRCRRARGKARSARSLSKNE